MSGEGKPYQHKVLSSFTFLKSKVHIIYHLNHFKHTPLWYQVHTHCCTKTTTIHPQKSFYLSKLKLCIH